MATESQSNHVKIRIEVLDSNQKVTLVAEMSTTDYQVLLESKGGTMFPKHLAFISSLMQQAKDFSRNAWGDRP